MVDKLLPFQTSTSLAPLHHMVKLGYYEELMHGIMKNVFTLVHNKSRDRTSKRRIFISDDHMHIATGFATGT